MKIGYQNHWNNHDNLFIIRYGCFMNTLSKIGCYIDNAKLPHRNYSVTQLKLHSCGIAITWLRRCNYMVAALQLHDCGIAITWLRHCDYMVAALLLHGNKPMIAKSLPTQKGEIILLSSRYFTLFWQVADLQAVHFAMAEYLDAQVL